MPLIDEVLISLNSVVWVTHLHPHVTYYIIRLRSISFRPDPSESVSSLLNDPPYSFISALLVIMICVHLTIYITLMCFSNIYAGGWLSCHVVPAILQTLLSWSLLCMLALRYLNLLCYLAAYH